MTELESIRRWYDYNSAARQGYFAALAKLPPEELKRDRGASFPTLLDILGHSMGGTAHWIVRMSALNGPAFTHFDAPEEDTVDFLRRFDTHLQAQVSEFFSRLTDAELDRAYLVPKNPPWWDEDFTTSIRSTLLHVVEHELQHRGELNALLWQINVEPPIFEWGEFEQRASRTSSEPPPVRARSASRPTKGAPHRPAARKAGRVS